MNYICEYCNSYLNLSHYTYLHETNLLIDGYCDSCHVLNEYFFEQKIKIKRFYYNEYHVLLNLEENKTLIIKNTDVVFEFNELIDITPFNVKDKLTSYLLFI